MEESNNILKEELKKWSDDNVWVTKKVRMDAELDRKNKNKRLNYYLIYYSGALAVMTFLNLSYPDGFKISIWASMISAVLPSVNIFQYKAGYNEEAQDFRKCYLELSKLEIKVKSKILGDNYFGMSDFEDIKEEYENILENHENHTDLDFKKFVQSELSKEKPNKKLKGKISKKDKRKLKWCSIKNVTVQIVLFLIPLIILAFKLFDIEMYQSSTGV
ncbi:MULTISPECIES: SLATT domain-containing protein [Vagococcus]|uniref:SMODS and SLOG-associating 2TM effector domain-containing protein n=1 Tax=Vagococcus fluvialis bH819 TaxID=1255619 RepID=A0A1X6WMA7_9ENTE|nr:MULTISPECIES: SLATT domain-containing protein [Vagococcus]SLM85464.1 hypothetical protein FM121_05150 [Vagococcus fluvialis bH819]HCM89243.1 hypothetical protein [Vagococcus sp.]